MLNRLKEKYVLVRNPMNIHQVSKIDLSPDVVDAIVFWTKNPTPMLPYLEQIKDYTYYFQFTLSAYGPDVERNLPSKNKIIILDNLSKLSFYQLLDYPKHNKVQITTVALLLQPVLS